MGKVFEFGHMLPEAPPFEASHHRAIEDIADYKPQSRLDVASADPGDYIEKSGGYVLKQPFRRLDPSKPCLKKPERNHRLTSESGEFSDRNYRISRNARDCHNRLAHAAVRAREETSWPNNPPIELDLPYKIKKDAAKIPDHVEEKILVPGAETGKVEFGGRHSVDFKKYDDGPVAVTYQGDRLDMEDKVGRGRFDVKFADGNKQRVDVFMVADGSGGPLTAELLTDEKSDYYVPRTLKHQFDFYRDHLTLPKADARLLMGRMPPLHLYNAFKTTAAVTQEAMQDHLHDHQPAGRNPASMLSMAAVSKNIDNPDGQNTGKLLIGANSGDAAVHFSTPNSCVRLSENHSLEKGPPDDKQANIRNARSAWTRGGGVMLPSGKTGGEYRMYNPRSKPRYHPTSKGYGFHGNMETVLNPRPTLIPHEIAEKSGFATLASDGVISDHVFSGKDVSEFIQLEVAKDVPLEAAAAKVLVAAHITSHRNGYESDNMSLFVVPLKDGDISNAAGAN